MDNRKIIFLDFDGVITVAKSRWKLSKPHLDILGSLLDRTNAKLVISSSWRFRDVESTIEEFSNEDGYFMGGMVFPFCDKIIGVTPRFRDYGQENLHIPRGSEIRAWNIENSTPHDRYVILDDDTDMLYEQRNNFVHIDGNVGITNEDSEKAYNILTNIN